MFSIYASRNYHLWQIKEDNPKILTRFQALCTCFVDHCMLFCPFFLLAIVLYVHLWLRDSSYPFSIFKPFLLICLVLSVVVFVCVLLCWSFSCALCTPCCQFLWIAHSWLLLRSVLSNVYLNCWRLWAFGNMLKLYTPVLNIFRILNIWLFKTI
jgi:hypothetical protein